MRARYGRSAHDLHQSNTVEAFVRDILFGGVTHHTTTVLDLLGSYTA